jgi:hypothetical protein
MKNIYVDFTAPGKWRVTAHRSAHGAFRLVLSTPEGNPIAFNETFQVPTMEWINTVITRFKGIAEGGEITISE